MEIHIAMNDQKWVSLAADQVEVQLRKNPASALSFATGATTLPLFDELISRHEDGRIDFSQATCFQLDEYRELGSEHPASCAHTLINRFYNCINIRKENCHFLDGLCSNLEDFCRDYDSLIQDGGGLDLQILGIGLNGHIGFNQPGTPFNSPTHPAKVEDFTWHKNTRFFNNPADNPRDALTMGIATIMSAKKIILMANGGGKKDILCKALFGPVIEDVPSSVLQKHPNVLVILDQSLSKLCSS
jgi:glucosamine-6-phosphate deaminase